MNYLYKNLGKSISGNRNNFFILKKVIFNSWNIPLYSSRYKKIGLKKYFETIKDLSNYPLIRRKDFIKKFPFDNYKIDNIKYIFNLKSDISPKESCLPLSNRDFIDYTQLECYKFQLIGVNKKDRCSIIAFSQNSMIPMANALMKLGATYVPLDGDETIIFNNIINFKVTVIFTVPQFLYRLIDYVKLRNLKTSLRIVITTGSKIKNFKQIAKYVKKYLGARLMETIGSTELGTFAISCKNHSGYYHFIDKYQFIEIINPETLNLDIKGEIVITPLWKKDYPLIRFATGDYIELEKNNSCSCSCNNKWMFMGIVKRLDSTVRLERFLLSLRELYNQILELFLYQYFFDKIFWRLTNPPIVVLLLIRNSHSDKVLLFIEKGKSIITLRKTSPINQLIATSSSASLKIIYCSKSKLIDVFPKYQDLRDVAYSKIPKKTKQLLSKYKFYFL